MNKQKINSSSVSNTTQRLYFAYQKGKYVSKDSMNEYIFGISNLDASNINYLFEETFFTSTKEGVQTENSTLATS